LYVVSDIPVTGVPMAETGPGSDVDLTDEALRRLYPRLRRFAAVVAPVEVGPDDLLQEAFERFFAHGPSSVAHVEVYMRQIIVRTASNHRRRLGRLRGVLDRVARLGVVTVADPAYPSDLAFLEHLGPTARAVLYLYEIEDVAFDAIADQLGMSIAAVKQTAVRARRQLRQHIEQEST
jgi:DNA-directed RNA polymerase specialized sigma24 family protein